MNVFLVPNKQFPGRYITNDSLVCIEQNNVVKLCTWPYTSSLEIEVCGDGLIVVILQNPLLFEPPLGQTSLTVLMLSFPPDWYIRAFAPFTLC